MRLTQLNVLVTSNPRHRRALALAASTLGSVLLLGCSTEPDDALSDTSQPQASASALHTSSAATPSPQVAPAAPPKGGQGGTAEVAITFNHAPSVTNVLSDLGRLDAGDQTQLRVIAFDSDGDRLTYAWNTECTGSFNHPSSPTPVFTLDALPAVGSCDLVITVRDEHGGQNRGILTLTAAPPPAVVVQDPA